MSKGLRITLIVGLVLVLIGMIFMGIGWMRGARSFDFSNLDIGISGVNFGTSNDFEEIDSAWNESGSYTVPASEIRKVEINWVSGNVTVTPSGSSEISFTERCKEPLTDTNSLRWRVKNGTLTIQFCKKQRLTLKNLPEKDLEILLPAALATNLDQFDFNGVSSPLQAEGLSTGTLNADTVSDSVTLRDCAAEEICIGTVSGAVQLLDCQADRVECGSVSARMDLTGALKECTLSAVSGAITVDTTAEKAEVKANTVSGKVSVTGDLRRLDTDTTSGDVTVMCSGQPTELDIETTSGKVHLTLPSDSGFTLDYDSASGKLTSDLAMVTQGSLHVYGDGSAEINVDTASGGLTVDAR